MGAILDYALDYAEAGYAVIPVKPSDKAPYTAHGLKEATTDPETIRGWWNRWPDANVAVACGKVSHDIIVLDVDVKQGKNGLQSVTAWQAAHDYFPETVVAHTPSGGYHYFFRVSDPGIYKNRVEAIPGVDIRGDGAYVVVYPSANESGKMYTWRHGVSILDTDELADANASVLELLELNARNSTAKKQDAAKRQRVDMHHVPEGQRNDTLFRFASKMVGSGISRDAALEAARAEVATWDNPLPDFEIVKTVDSAYNSYEPNEETIYGNTRPEIDENGEYIPRLPAELSREFLLNPPPKSKPVVVNYLREGEAMLLSGPPKAGKSFLIVQLAIAIATGSRWLGMTCQKKTVLYIDAELSASMTGERIRDIRERMGISYLPDNLHVINTKTGQKDQITLRDVADDFVHGIRSEEVVIVDPLYMFLNSDENDNSQMKKEMEQIRRIASIGVTVIVVHHMAKGTQAGKMSIDRASGAGVLGRFFDSILTLNLLNREATDPARPERVEADTRSFQQPMPVNLWFDGFHTIDTAGDLADRDLNDPKKTMTEQKSANDAGRLNHCYHWMKDNCMLQPDGSFTVENMIEAYETNYNKRMARTTITGQLDRANFVKYKGIIEETVGDKVTRRKKNLYVPDGLEDI